MFLSQEAFGRELGVSFSSVIDGKQERAIQT